MIGKEDTRRNLLAAIRFNFDYIHFTIPGIVPVEKVPLPKFSNVPPVDYQWLLNLDNKGITIVRDIRYIGYKDNVKTFVQNIGCGKCVIVVVSQGYLQSANCMFELL